jgi:hypothetical protein
MRQIVAQMSHVARLRRLPSFRGRGTMAALLGRRSKGGNRGGVGSLALSDPYRLNNQLRMVITRLMTMHVTTGK